MLRSYLIQNAVLYIPRSLNIKAR